jgi:hypothetical protein
MGEKQIWNDQSRDALRKRLRSAILGELRLAKRGHEEILDGCREVCIQDEAPNGEWENFLQFAAEELERAETQLASEKAAWPKETDCDRLDRVEAALRERGILLWQVSPCCDTCSSSEVTERIEVIESRHPGFGERIRGYSFFIDQNMPERLAENCELTVFLAYGSFSADGAEVPAADYEKASLGIAREICECLRHEGFEPDWDGDFARKIGVSLIWQRRAKLE